MPVVKPPKPMPEGYTFTRCDIYTKDEFLKIHPEEDAYNYVKEHDKEYYNTDDEIALRQISDSRVVNSLGKSSTKSYAYGNEYGGFYDIAKWNMER